MGEGSEIVLANSRYEMVRDAGSLIEVIKENSGGESYEIRDLPQVRIPSGGSTTWELPSGEAVKSFEGVMIYANRDMRKLYTTKDVTNSPPDCQSQDGVMGLTKDGEHVSCQGCPSYVYDKALGGSRCKPCGQILVMLPTMGLPVCINVPVTSVKALRHYLLAGPTAFKSFYWGCETRFELEKEQGAGGQAYAKLKLTWVRNLDKEHIEVLRKWKELFKPKPVEDAPVF